MGRSCKGRICEMLTGNGRSWPRRTCVQRNCRERVWPMRSSTKHSWTRRSYSARISVVYSNIVNETELPPVPVTPDTRNVVHEFVIGTQVMF